MANYIKSFNFRNGVQVDNGNFMVNEAGRVGIGTTVPDKILDVRGNTKIVGHVTATDASVSGIVTVGSITIDGSTGNISATNFTGSAGQNFGDQPVVAIATDGFIAGATGLTTTSSVGIGTTNALAKLDVRGTLGISNTTDTSVRTTITSNANGLLVNHDDNSATILQNQGTERLRITDVGDVGIGTDDPGTKLDVRGSLNVTGISTLGVTTVTDLTAQQLSVSGLSTFTGIVSFASTVTAPVLHIEGGSFNAGFDNFNDAAIIIDEESTIYTKDSDRLRNLIQKKSDVIIIGQHNTSLIDGIDLKPGATGGQVKLHSGGTANNVKLETTGAGVTVFGTTQSQQLNVSGVSTFSDDILIGTGATVGFGSTAYFKDDVGAFFGDDDDLRIYHDSINEHSYIADKGTGNLVLQSDNKIEMITFNPPLGGGAEKMLEAVKNGAVTLYFDGNKRIETSNTGVTVTGSIGIGTSAPSADLQIRKASGNATLEVISDTASASISIGNSVGAGNSSASINYGSTGGFGVYSTEQSFDIINRDIGNINYFLGNNATSDSGFRWHKGSTNQLMTLTGIGSLGIGITNPQHLLSVQGISTFTGAAYFNNDVTIEGNLDANKIGIGTDSTRCVLDLKESTDNDTGFVLLPSRTTTSRDNISPLIEGALIYNSTNKRLELYNGTAWVGIATEA